MNKDELIYNHLQEFLTNWFEDFMENEDITRIQLYNEIVESVNDKLQGYMSDEKIDIIITKQDIIDVVEKYDNFGVNLLMEDRLYNDKNRKVYVINI